MSNWHGSASRFALDLGMAPGTRIGTKAVIGALGQWNRGGGTSLQSRLVAAFRQAIETGVLASGSVLPAERALARDLSVSRFTVTAALTELKAQGLLASRQGSGTTVMGHPQLGPDGATVLPGLLGSSRGIDLAASSPTDLAALPPVQVDLDGLLRAQTRHGYSPAGIPELRALIAGSYAASGMATTADEVLVSNGAQHALALALTQLTVPGDAILIDDPTYPGMIDLLAARQLRPVVIPRHRDGFDPEAYRAAARSSGARLAYLQTLLHNPTGCGLDDFELRGLAKVCDDEDLVVIEDLVLGDLRFDGRSPAPLAARCRTALVVAVSSVSKLGWGGLRVGWLRAPASLVDRLVRTRLADDLGSSIPSQVMTQVLLSEAPDLATSRQAELRARADQTLGWCRTAAPDWDPWTPLGGLSLWIDVGSGAAALAQRSARAGVVVATGSSACIDADGDRYVRICFDRSEAVLTEGLRRLRLATGSPPDGDASVAEAPR